MLPLSYIRDVLLLTRLVAASRISFQEDVASTEWNTYGMPCGGTGYRADTCTKEVPHVLQCFSDGDIGRAAGYQEGGRCYIPHQAICQDAEKYCRPGTECRAIEGMPDASIKFCMSPEELPSTVLSSSLASKQLREAGLRGWVLPMADVVRDLHSVKQERTFFLNPRALDAYGVMQMGTESCRACWVLAWQFHLEKALREKYERCTFDQDLYNAVCVWLHDAGWQPQDLGKITQLFGPQNPGDKSMATSFCQWSKGVQKICPSYLRTAEDVWNELHLARCNRKRFGSVWNFSATGKKLCYKKPGSSELVKAFHAILMESEGQGEEKDGGETLEEDEPSYPHDAHHPV